VPGFPGLVALNGLLEGRWRKAAVVLAVIGFLVSSRSLISFYERYYPEPRGYGATNVDVMWAPSRSPRSPQLNIWQASDHQVRDAVKNDMRELFRGRGAPSQAISSFRALRIVAVW
jgi:hypothetical protein